MLRTFRPVLSVLATCWIGTALAGPPRSPIRDCNQFFGALHPAKMDSSIEMELGANTPTMNLFTTTDGTLAPVLERAELPEGLAKTLRDAYPEVADLKTLPWDSLDSASQVALIEHAAKVNNHQFFLSRKVPGLLYRDTIELSFTRPTEFLGKHYPAGTHKFASSEIFRGTAIEFKSPTSMTNNLGFELHLRSPAAPSTNLKNAWALEGGLGYKPGNLHQHIVAPLPQAKILANPLLQATRMTEYYRRINLYAEMKAVLNGGTITQNISENAVYFGNMKDENLSSVFDYFATGATKNLSSNNKIAWVGMRGSDAYNGSEKLWGLEFRDIDPRYPVAELGRMMDAAQSSLVRDEYGIPEEKIQRWMEHNVSYLEKIGKGGIRPNILHADTALTLKYPQTIPNGLFASLNPDLRTLLALNLSEKMQLGLALTKAHENNLSVAMLVKNWAQDPLFFENPEVVKKIHEVQAQALRRLMAGEKQKDVMQYFLKRSGIHYMFEKSLGI